MKPLIGITPSLKYCEDVNKKENPNTLSPEGFITNAYYAHKVERAGGLPVGVPYCRTEGSIEALAGSLDGILFTGGSDLNPMLYGEPVAGSLDIVNDRDELEMKLFQAFYAAKKPILGICRGLQLMNVFFKGALIQDILTDAASQKKEPLDHARFSEPFSLIHTVRAEKGSRLISMIGEEARVNSSHHQAVREAGLGKGLVVTARSEDGLIEAVELPGYPFMIGVQWHPERLEEPHMNIFRAFVESSAK